MSYKYLNNIVSILRTLLIIEYLSFNLFLPDMPDMKICDHENIREVVESTGLALNTI